MDAKTVNRLEEQLEGAIRQVILKMGLQKLPLLPSHRTMHRRAKAGTTVYETPVENMRYQEDSE